MHSAFADVVWSYLQCYSVSVAGEWIGRLTALVSYWTRRERVDAIEQMELQPMSQTQRPRSQRERERARGDEDDEFDSASPLLGHVYNLCISDGCRSFLRAGRAYIKKGLRGTFKERYLFLLPGVLLEYNTKQRDVSGQTTKVVYHCRVGALNLRGCYVYSGRLCQSVLDPNSSGTGWDPASSRQQFPRIYSSTDGLRTSDEDEDCTLVVFKRKHQSAGLGRKGKLTVFRARSKVRFRSLYFARAVD